MENVKDFVAIDFEWQSTDHDPCAIGMVKVKENVVISKFYSLIRPEVDVWYEHCCRVHGITKEMVNGAPTLKELEGFIENYAEGFTLVGHNYNTSERCVIDKHFREGSPLKNASFIDTYKLVGGTLIEACSEHGVVLAEHHDALEDATATACLYIKVQGENLIKPVTSEAKSKKKSGSKRDSSLNFMLDADLVPYQNTPFMGSTFVVSGFPSAVRDRIIGFVRDNFGGKNAGSISSNTKVLIGHSTKCGPTKLVDARKYNCIIYNENTLLSEVIKPCGLEEEWKKIIG